MVNHRVNAAQGGEWVRFFFSIEMLHERRMKVELRGDSNEIRVDGETMHPNQLRSLIISGAAHGIHAVDWDGGVGVSVDLLQGEVTQMHETILCAIVADAIARQRAGVYHSQLSEYESWVADVT
jgi:hypothetical protein